MATACEGKIGTAWGGNLHMDPVKESNLPQDMNQYEQIGNIPPQIGIINWFSCKLSSNAENIKWGQ